MIESLSYSDVGSCTDMIDHVPFILIYPLHSKDLDEAPKQRSGRGKRLKSKPDANAFDP